MRPVFAMPVFLLSAAVVFASSAPTPGGPGAESGQPREMVPGPVEKLPVRVLGVAESFVMPSGNIGCIYIPEGGTATYEPADGGPELSCDRVEPKYVRATLGRSGKAVVRTNVGDRGCCGGDRIIPYGETWSAGPFTCFSERTGLTCKRDDGHSFLLSRTRLRAD
ncbi:hypothetical protein AB3G45_10340 [Shinella sp. S4-D37]|uniref:hypothetical protein n=1 Tax=Shinella sp. S4-D37 TaxID=3161999 RepID=UPI00346679A8